MSIKENTIVSTTDRKVTLLQWLKGVEKALKDSTITGIELIDKGNNAYSLRLSFEDGSSIETEPVTLLQPIKAAAIENGNLFITLTDGTRIDCGEVGASLGSTIIYGDFSVTGGNATFGANVEVDGTLVAKGAVIADNVQSGSFLMPKATDEQINKDLVLVPTTTGEMATNGQIIANYAHIRNSNGKLSIVALISYECAADFTKTNNELLFNAYNIYLPKTILNKIFPIVTGTANYKTILSEVVIAFAVDTATGKFSRLDDAPKLIFELDKDNGETNLEFSVTAYRNAGSFISGKTYAWRFEANLIL